MKNESIKFAFITDTHIDNNYGNRLDDAQSSILSKISQCYKLAEKNGCQFMIHGGDVFNRVSINTIQELNIKFCILHSQLLQFIFKFAF